MITNLRIFAFQKLCLKFYGTEVDEDNLEYYCSYQHLNNFKDFFIYFESYYFTDQKNVAKNLAKALKNYPVKPYKNPFIIKIRKFFSGLFNLSNSS